MIRKINIIMVILMHLFLDVSAQTSICHLDRPYYFPGQYLHYAFYTDIIKDDSFIVSVQLSKDKSEIDQHFLMLHLGSGEGYFSLPFDVAEGEYFIQISAFDAKSADPVDLLLTPLSILSDKMDPAANTQIINPEVESLTSNIQIEVSEQIKTRQITQCKVRVPSGKPGDLLSIVIRDKNLYPVGKSIRIQSNDGGEEELLTYLPLKGKRQILNKKANEKAFLFTCNPEQLDFRFNWVNPDGNFFIKMNPYYGERDLYFIDNGGNDVEVRVMPLTEVKQASYSFVSDATLESAIEANNQRKKIYQLFNKVEENVLQDTLPYKIEVLAPDYDIDVQDFSIRGKLVDLLKEVITPFKFRKENDDQYRIKVLYEVLDLKYFYDSDPVFIINGMLTQDFSYIANLPLQDIKRLKIYARLETIRAMKLVDVGGVGVIEMVDPLFSLAENQRLPHTLYKGLQVPVKYPVMAETDSDIPQLKSLLYWMPDARLNDQSEYEFSIPVSDDISTFQIEVLHPSTQTMGHRDFQVELNKSQF